MPIQAAQDLLNTPNRINTIMGRYAEGSDARALDKAVQSMFGRGYDRKSGIPHVSFIPPTNGIVSLPGLTHPALILIVGANAFQMFVWYAVTVSSYYPLNV